MTDITPDPIAESAQSNRWWLEQGRLAREADFSGPDAPQKLLERLLRVMEPDRDLDRLLHSTVYGKFIKFPRHYSSNGDHALRLMDKFVNKTEYTYMTVSSSYWHGHSCHVSLSDNEQWVYSHTCNGQYAYEGSSMTMAICRGILRATLGYEFYKIPLFSPPGVDPQEERRIRNPYTWLAIDYARKHDVAFDTIMEKALQGYLEEAGEV
jgi:hypothetical protein